MSLWFFLTITSVWCKFYAAAMLCLVADWPCCLACGLLAAGGFQACNPRESLKLSISYLLTLEELRGITCSSVQLLLPSLEVFAWL